MNGCKMFSFTLKRTIGDYIYAVAEEGETLIHRMFLYMQVYDIKCAEE
jgi:hypothetical protein